MYMITPISVFMSSPKKAKNATLAIQTLGVTDLKHGMLHKLTLGVTWAGSLLATPLPLVFKEEKCQKINYIKLLNKDWI